MLQPITRRIAVVIPVYRARYVAECLASVFAQVVPPDQVIVIDDGSPDRDAFERAVAPYAGRLLLLRQSNRGAGAARNRGVSATAADLIAFLDADDAWYPTFLSEQVRRLSDGDFTLVYANARVVGDGPLAGRCFMDGAPSNGHVTTEALLAQRCTVLTSSVLVRREALLWAGLFDEELRRGQDFDMWVRLVHAGAHVAYTTTPLLDRRVHGENLSGDRISELERGIASIARLSAKLRLTDRERRAADDTVRSLRAALYAEFGKRSLSSGNVRQARVQFGEAIAHSRHWKFHVISTALRVAPRLLRQLYMLKTRAGRTASADS